MEKLKLHPIITQSLLQSGFKNPTPIQAEAIPIALEGKHIIGCAQTGTGKTLAFLVPILSQLLKNKTSTKKITGLILVPTRELAGQIDLVWKKLTGHSHSHASALLIGGASFGKQTSDLRRHPSLVIATPGRLVDHLQQKTIVLDQIDILVLDEADRMLDMGFAPQLNRINERLPKKRQTLFFTATWSAAMDQLSRQYVHGQAHKIVIGEMSKASHLIEQSLVPTTAQTKNDTLLDQINLTKGSVIVFARTQVRTDRVYRFLAQYGVLADRLHGGRTQAQRKKVLDEFTRGKVRVLVATDLASRGIDVKNIERVINFDLPQLPEDYIHRIGRTGRAGNEGLAVSLVTPEDRLQWREIAKLLKQSGSPVPVLPAGAAHAHSSSSASATLKPTQPDHRNHRQPDQRPGQRSAQRPSKHPDKHLDERPGQQRPGQRLDQRPSQPKQPHRKGAPKKGFKKPV